MNQPLTIERRAIARALPWLIGFLVITAATYTILIAGEFGFGIKRLRMISAVIALIFAALIFNSTLGLLDIVRYADIHWAEQKRRKNSPYERC
ncbi:hypothetical protein [Yoonia sp. SS1-5]|uniref:Uncharacterized protein n=1 Tax=Yoonia rhodophyticola TaxID=3137370 RepID=A0AAN0MAR7_9RHOB